MKNVFMYASVMFTLLMFLMIILYIISFKTIMDREKNSPFECGFDPFDSSRIPFSSHFFMVAVIFLIFDVELVVIMPMIIIIPSLNMIDMYLIMFLYVLILIIGLYHEWINNMLNWI